MTSRYTARAGGQTRLQRASEAPAVPLFILIALIAAAAVYVVCVLWPRWPARPVALDAPALPITIAGVAFNIPPAAIRVPVQRRGGAQDRVDLAFLWPSLGPADALAKPPAGEVAAAASKIADRIFLTIAVAGDTLSPEDRVKSIYPRYASAEPVAGPSGLAVLAFRDGSPYQGEDLIYDAAAPERFLVRCTRDGATPGICLYERRRDRVDVTARFPRDWLDDWHTIAGATDQLIDTLESPALRPR
jgi:hypothetical protein